MFIIKHMTPNPLTIRPDISIPAARELLRTNNFRHLPVVDDENRLVGMVTDRDLRSAFPSSVLSEKKLKTCLAELDQTPVSSIMSRKFFTLGPWSTLDDALIILDRENIGALPVLEDDRVIGIFSIRDLIAAYRKIFGLGDRGSAMIVVQHDGKPKPLARIAQVFEDEGIRFTRLIRTESSRPDHPDYIYLRVNTFNIHGVHTALKKAGFAIVIPDSAPKRT